MALEDNVYANVKIYDGEDNEVAVAPKGTTPQEGIGVAAAPYKTVGWVNDGGIEESISPSDDEWRAWQGNKVVKRKITKADTTYKFSCFEDNAVTHGLKTRGATVTVVGTGAEQYAKVVRNRDTATDERMWRFRFIGDDGSIEVHEFLGTHTLSGTISRTATEPSIFEFTVKPIGDVNEYSNAASRIAEATAA